LGSDDGHLDVSPGAVGRLELRVNGDEHRVEAPIERTLAEVLRLDLGLTGTKIACGE